MPSREAGKSVLRTWENFGLDRNTFSQKPSVHELLLCYPRSDVVSQR